LRTLHLPTKSPFLVALLGFMLGDFEISESHRIEVQKRQCRDELNFSKQRLNRHNLFFFHGQEFIDSGGVFIRQFLNLIL
jgi:hypothetical protein